MEYKEIFLNIIIVLMSIWNVLLAKSFATKWIIETFKYLWKD